jgi:PTS system nitrogen regulatory IIA component
VQAKQQRESASGRRAAWQDERVGALERDRGHAGELGKIRHEAIRERLALVAPRARFYHRRPMVTLADHLSAEHVIWLESDDKNAALSRLLQLLSRSKVVRDPQDLQNAILSREVMMSTGVGYGIAIPHAKIPTVEGFILALGISPGGIAYGSVVDDQPVKLICMIAGPEGRNAEYLKLLSVLMKFIKSEKGLILNATHPDEVRRFAANYELPG